MPTTQAQCKDTDAQQVLLANILHEINRHILGQDTAVRLVLASILAGGHAMLIGAPGLAKTRIVAVVAETLGLQHNRVQGTPDLMPSDILGAEILEEDSKGKRHFRLLHGPVFCQLLMVDEINRASPKTQAALLQAMQEQVVTLAGTTYPLPTPFHVLATMNPLEHEGTYPLPEAQLDRFLAQIPLTYPDAATERAIIQQTTIGKAASVSTMADTATMQALQATVRDLPVAERILETIINLVQATRPEQSPHALVKKYVAYGAGPRAAQAFMLLTRALAFMDGRFAPSLDDIRLAAVPILGHRTVLNYQAQADGVTAQSLIDALLPTV